MERKSWTIKKLSLLVAVLLLATVTAGGSLAYIFTHTGRITNTFKAVEVTCDVVEEFDNIVKSDVKIKNTGDVDAYIRAEIIITWQNSDGDVLATVPVAEEDYYIEFAAGSNWDLETSDGYYYYTKVVPSGEYTGALISECKQLKAAPQEGYYLCVEVIADAIQATPIDVVEDNWEVEVSGTTISK